MRRLFTSSVLLLLTAAFTSGCGESLPKGMPRLYPASLTVTQEGQPLEGAIVQLVSEATADSPWGAGGTTDASGKVNLHTNGKYKGVPLGKYKVTISKMVTDPHPHPELKDGPEFRKYLAILKTLKTYRVVELQYSVITQTPLTIEITKEEKSYTVDAGKKIKTVVKLLQ